MAASPVATTCQWLREHKCEEGASVRKSALSLLRPTTPGWNCGAAEPPNLRLDRSVAPGLSAVCGDVSPVAPAGHGTSSPHSHGRRQDRNAGGLVQRFV